MLWSSHKQNLVTLSSTESELVVLCEVTTKAIWIKRLWLGLGCSLDAGNYVIYEDNQSYLKLVKGANWNSKHRKHNDVKYQFVQEVAQRMQFNYNVSGYWSTDDSWCIHQSSRGPVNFIKFRKILRLSWIYLLIECYFIACPIILDSTLPYCLFFFKYDILFEGVCWRIKQNTFLALCNVRFNN